jgi:Tol biopolymer transport system component
MSISKSCALCASALLLLLCLGAQSAAAAPETPNLTFAASASAAGELADGVGLAEYTSVGISEDGRFVAFQSTSQNLGEAGPHGVTEGFVKDLETGAVELVSRADGVGGEPAGEPGVTTLEISGDGRFVVFTSAATNLGTPLPGEEAGEAHVYRRDLETGETTLVDRVSGPGGLILARGAEGDGISADGTVVAFTDRVANLEDPLGDHAETAEAVGYVRNLATGATTAVSRASGAAGELGDRGAEGLSLSPDGRYASFYTYATNLGVSGERYEVYLRDTAADTTTLLSQNALGEPADLATYGGNLSGGAGCFGTLASNATNLLEPERSGLVANQTYVFDRCATPGTNAITSVQEGGALFFFAGAGYAAPTVTADGKEAIFAGSTNGSCGCALYLRDLAAATTTQLDRASGAAGAPADAEVQNYAISASGCRVAFATRATNLVAATAPDPGAEPTELYVRQLAACHEEAKSPPAGDRATVPNAPPAPIATGVRLATRVGLEHLGPRDLWLTFDGPGRARIRIQKVVTGRRHGWHEVRGLIATAAAAGPLKVALPALAPGRYRLKLRLQGDPDNPTLTRELKIGAG